MKYNDFMSWEFKIKDGVELIFIFIISDWFGQYFHLNNFHTDLIIGISLYLWGGLGLYIYYRKHSKLDKFPNIYVLLRWLAIMLSFIYIADMVPKWIGFHRSTCWLIGVLILYFLFIYIFGKYFEAKGRQS